MYRTQDTRAKCSNQLTRSKDFSSRFARDDREDAYKENEDMNSVLGGRLMYPTNLLSESVRVSVASSRRGRNMHNDSRSEKNENLECKEDFFKNDDYNYEEEDTKHNIFAHQRSYSQSQGNLSSFFRQSLHAKPGQIQPTRASFKKQ